MRSFLRADQLAALLLALNASLVAAVPYRSHHNGGHHSSSVTTVPLSSAPSKTPVSTAIAATLVAQSSSPAKPDVNVLALAPKTPLTGYTAAGAAMCNDNQQTIIYQGTKDSGLMVVNQRVGESTADGRRAPGTVCTTYGGMVDMGSGIPGVHFTAVTNLEKASGSQAWNQVYSKVAINGVNAGKHTLSQITSLPVTYQWSRTNTTEFKGNVCFDFILGRTATSTSGANAFEFQIWLHNNGQAAYGSDNSKNSLGQFTFGGHTWNVWRAINTNIGTSLTELVPTVDMRAEGTFSVDMKALITSLNAKIGDTTNYYITTFDAGTEQYYGHATLDAYVAIKFNTA